MATRPAARKALARGRTPTTAAATAAPAPKPRAAHTAAKPAAPAPKPRAARAAAKPATPAPKPRAARPTGRPAAPAPKPRAARPTGRPAAPAPKPRAAHAAAKPAAPPDAAWRPALGRAAAAWDALLAEIGALPGPPRVEWKFYGAKHGWQVKVSTAQRALLYLVPREGHFMAALALRPAALARLGEAGLPAERVAAIRAARPGPEGHPARVEVRGARELALVRKLVALKLST